MPKLVPIEHEDALWDFKQTVALDPLTGKKDPDYAGQCCELVKDIVAFHNTFGGCIIIGVDDKSKEIVGFNSNLDVDLVNSRIKADVNCNIDFTFKKLNYLGKDLGLIFVPRRQDGAPPLQFRRDAKPKVSGSKAYKNGDIYFRDEDSSAPAKDAEALALLFSDVKRSVSAPTEVKVISITDNNLRARDPGLIGFVGRDEDLGKLWRWLVDRFNPVRLVSGVGGVGKTTLVREFTEEVLERSPLGFERVIWLTAKRKQWLPLKGKTIDLVAENSPHFGSPDDLFRQILFDLGFVETDIGDDWLREDYIEKLVEALTLTPSFLVIDDLDTLDPDHQTDVFQSLVSILSQTVPNAVATSRAIITARLNIGASPAQMMRIDGFNEAEFSDYIRSIVNELEFELQLKRDSKLFKKFYAATEGSPLFAASILRIVARGESLDACLNKWKGASGEEVRSFAFERELSQLTDSQLRTLYVICCLESCSFIELRQITQSNQQLLEDDLQRLRDFHLVAHNVIVEEGGMNYRIPNNIALLSDLIKERVKDHARLSSAVLNYENERAIHQKKLEELSEESSHSGPGVNQRRHSKWRGKRQMRWVEKIQISNVYRGEPIFGPILPIPNAQMQYCVMRKCWDANALNLLIYGSRPVQCEAIGEELSTSGKELWKHAKHQSMQLPLVERI
jgi:Cdc6-like AAA superfamily ATPase